MSYPDAYCVKCGTHTDTQKKHTVMLQNNVRALKGVCPTCTSEVYKILPKGKAYLTKVPMSADELRRYPDAFCVKCQTHTPTVDAHTVMFENMRRAVTGSCGRCGSEVYRILGAKDQAQLAVLQTSGAAHAQTPGKTRAVMPRSALGAAIRSNARPVSLPVGERRMMLVANPEPLTGRWSYYAAAGIVLGIVAACCVYSFL